MVIRGEFMLSDKIYELRNLKNWSQVQLAKKLSVSKQTISNWENNNIQPSVEMLVKIAELFSVSTDYLLERERIRLEVDGLSELQIMHIQEIINDIKAKCC